MDKNLKIMLAQLNPTVGDLENNSKIILETYKKASKNKVDILVFPEMFLSGYQIQDLVFRPTFQKDLEKYIRYIGKHCINNTYLLFGSPVVEKGQIFNAYLLFKKGKVKIISKKYHLPHDTVCDETRYFSQSYHNVLLYIKVIKIGCPIF